MYCPTMTKEKRKMNVVMMLGARSLSKDISDYPVDMFYFIWIM